MRHADVGGGQGRGVVDAVAHEGHDCLRAGGRILGGARRRLQGHRLGGNAHVGVGGGHEGGVGRFHFQNALVVLLGIAGLGGGIAAHGDVGGAPHGAQSAFCERLHPRRTRGRARCPPPPATARAVGCGIAGDHVGGHSAVAGQQSQHRAPAASGLGWSRKVEAPAARPSTDDHGAHEHAVAFDDAFRALPHHGVELLDRGQRLRKQAPVMVHEPPLR